MGGRVLPVWPAPPPAWLTRDHWAPLALVDHGEDSRRGNRGASDLPGGCEPAVPPAAVRRRRGFRDRRPARQGRHRLARGPRVPAAGSAAAAQVCTTRASSFTPRFSRTGWGSAYHRRWHTGHGHFHALLRSEHMEQTSVGTLFGVPAHLYRQAVGDLVGWVRAKAIGEPARAFHHEVRLRFFAGFFRTRRREFLGKPRHERRKNCGGCFASRFRDAGR